MLCGEPFPTASRWRCERGAGHTEYHRAGRIAWGGGTEVPDRHDTPAQHQEVAS